MCEYTYESILKTLPAFSTLHLPLPLHHLYLLLSPTLHPPIFPTLTLLLSHNIKQCQMRSLAVLPTVDRPADSLHSFRLRSEQVHYSQEVGWAARRSQQGPGMN